MWNVTVSNRRNVIADCIVAIALIFNGEHTCSIYKLAASQFVYDDVIPLANVHVY